MALPSEAATKGCRLQLAIAAMAVLEPEGKTSYNPCIRAEKTEE
jgi:hypothetical protein